MGSSDQPNLTLLVINAQQLESGLSAVTQWQSSGGIIGSGHRSQWVLKDSDGQIKSEHCEVLMVDGAFCIRDLSGDTYINATEMPLGTGQLAKLAHKDHIKIGPYELRVMVGDYEDDHTSGPLSQLFEETTEDLLADDMIDIDTVVKQEHEVSTEPLGALDVLMKVNDEESFIHDELEVTTEENQPSIVPNEDLTLRTPNFTVQADSDNEIGSSMTLKRILSFGFGKKAVIQSKSTQQQNIYQANELEPNQQTTHDNVSEGLHMDEQTLDLLEEEVAKSIQPEASVTKTQSATGGHLLTGPMLTGLGVQVDQTDDIERMHMLSQEMGESLQACIQGLLDLHKQVCDGRFGTLNRNLQPIEDNPLRLGLSYQETIKTLYDAEKSAVHLSAPAAIAESLRNVQAHNEAMQYATSEALRQILGAFSPQVLHRRFQNYKRSHQETAHNTDAWAWNMYCNYYQELTSHRQKGFEKLFWEIFEQTYDKKIREKQLEF
ncbi:type VI secretion system-associated FHA domain protein TagH [Vibrio diazotrophicus]|uniref:type VI secretion system-associated FHA domain protein TagH n=1 Tax=Vibrio diazotrophicus TaxID=685 RepID=UPI00142E7797|nr:type VI secretion system-associated FHA domain protein TagH [Vibrio diazotrophicus]NIY93397.1 type VI secretion system-associated FHA domain protein TagH [Vibrio diazotrophicus]